MAVADGFQTHAISFHYGQRHAVEVDAAGRIAEALGAASHQIITLDPAPFASSALTGGEAPVPAGRTDEQISEGIAPTYVPARNTVFLSYALAIAETLETGHIFIGVNAVDYSGYPDCRPEYIDAFQTMANLATKAAVEGRCPITIHAPLIAMTKAEIIQTGVRLGVDYALTTSCYDPAPGPVACGGCDSCLLRKCGFAEAGLPDPTRYR